MIGYIILGLVALFFAVILIRTLTFKPKAQPAISNEEVSFDSDAAVHALAELVKCKTISYNDHALEDDAEFQKLIDMLPTLYPKVFEVCTFQQRPVGKPLQRADFKYPGVKGGQQTDELFKLGILFQAGIVVGNGLAAHQLRQRLHRGILVKRNSLAIPCRLLFGIEAGRTNEDHRQEQPQQTQYHI